jgi:hypothetical protein
MTQRYFDPTEYTASSDWPIAEPVEERVLRLERLVEVLRQELISQNKKIELLFPQGRR